MTEAADWLAALRAVPMYLGLDLRGGVHFMLQVDMPAALTKKAESLAGDIRTVLREKDVRHGGISRNGQNIEIRLRDVATLAASLVLARVDARVELVENLVVAGEQGLLKYFRVAVIDGGFDGRAVVLLAGEQRFEPLPHQLVGVARQQRAAHLYHHDCHDEPALHAHARSSVPPCRCLAECSV